MFGALFSILQEEADKLEKALIKNHTRKRDRAARDRLSQALDHQHDCPHACSKTHQIRSQGSSHCFSKEKSSSD